ncbi:enoyl-CoA hydratase/isomerase family protein [Streptomyces uncialis]|uniref:enoyl-CoA hydratase/isomerase family protein n=1 Tax=Streptomyces uncialis TaxID=1048205 RepID=UPI00381BF40D
MVGPIREGRPGGADEQETRVRIETPEPGVIALTLDGPARRNALGLTANRQLAAALERLREDDCRVVVLTGAAGFFSAGGDLRGSMRADGADGGAGAPAARLGIAHRTLRGLRELDKPVIAAVEGGAVGIGWSLTLAADLVIAAEDAYFLAPFVTLGLVPDGGLAWTLSRTVGERRAAELLMLGDRLPAPAAAGLGLVNRVVPTGTAREQALALARRLAQGSADALGLTKRLLASAAHTPDFGAFLETEWVTAALATYGADHEEGRAAFAERRAPDFTRRDHTV